MVGFIKDLLCETQALKLMSYSLNPKIERSSSPKRAASSLLLLQDVIAEL